jgi:hypothetical protein
VLSALMSFRSQDLREFIILTRKSFADSHHRKKSRTEENIAAANIEFTVEEIKHLNEVVEVFETKGLRYNVGVPLLWG